MRCQLLRAAEALAGLLPATASVSHSLRGLLDLSLHCGKVRAERQGLLERDPFVRARRCKRGRANLPKMGCQVLLVKRCLTKFGLAGTAFLDRRRFQLGLLRRWGNADCTANLGEHRGNCVTPCLDGLAPTLKGAHEA